MHTEKEVVVSEEQVQKLQELVKQGVLTKKQAFGKRAGQRELRCAGCGANCWYGMEHFIKSLQIVVKTPSLVKRMETNNVMYLQCRNCRNMMELKRQDEVQNEEKNTVESSNAVSETVQSEST